MSAPAAAADPKCLKMAASQGLNTISGHLSHISLWNSRRTGLRLLDRAYPASKGLDILAGMAGITVLFNGKVPGAHDCGGSGEV